MTDGTPTRAADLADRVAVQSTIATRLIDLEGHPAHQLLAGQLRGATAKRWTIGREQLAGLWKDFAAYQAVVAEASVTSDPAQLRRLLEGESVEIGRTVVGDGILGQVERIERITLDALVARMDTAFGEVRDLLRSCQEQHEAFLSRMAPVADRLREVRGLAERLDAEPERIRAAALTRRIAELDDLAAADPLALDGGTVTASVTGVAADVEELAQRLGTAVALRDGWAAEMAAAAASVDAVAALRSATEQARATARELVTGPVTPLPPDHLRELRSRLAALDRGGWTTRATALLELRAAVTAATSELTTTKGLVDGLVERRAELRGRFEAYRARTVRLGRAEDPELLRLGDDLRELLWTRPCDLAAATRALAAYQRAIGRPT